MGGEKLCVVCSNDDYYKIFIVDVYLADDGGRQVALDNVRDIRIRGLPKLMSFCIVDSTLYIFGSCSLSHPMDSRYETRGVYKFNYSLIDVLNHKDEQDLVLEKSGLVECESMLNPEFYTPCIPTPDGKIVVHSYMILLDSWLVPESDLDEGEKEEDCEFFFRGHREPQFELFDPVNNSMVKLPRLEIRRPGLCYEMKDLRTGDWKELPGTAHCHDGFFFTVPYSFFKSKHELVVFIHSEFREFGGHFVTLDIESPMAREWQPYPSFFPGGPNCSAIVVDNCMFLTSDYGHLTVKNTSDGLITLQHPLSDTYMLPSDRWQGSSSLAPIHFDSTLQEYFFCVLTTKCSQEASHLVIDLLKI